ncbi:MAG: cytochrome c3 family protein [Anaerolineae bacterium]
MEVPFQELWAASAHADAAAEAFTHWDEEDPKEVPDRCAKCHSTPGYLDFLGVDGTAAGVVDNAAPIGTVVTCAACHNEATLTMTSVTFPSGVEVTGLGREARCMQCHQGRQSTVSVNDAIAEVGLTDEDTVSEDLGFKNIHYFAAAATQFGGVVMGGYQYEGKSYDARFAHVEGFNTCIGCHDSHTLKLRVEACSACHSGVSSAEDLRNVRMQGSEADYDSDGDVTEGIYYEIEGLREMLYQAIQAYATEVPGTPIVYDAHAYPYFFIDTNANGQPDEDEVVYPNKYNAWTARLLKAAYNYQVSIKDPGAFAHGGKYIIQLLYDSIEDLNPDLVAGLHRIDPGHFAGSEEAFRHWDEDGEVSGRCSKCHSATGLPFFLKEGVTASQPLANGFLCTTCHDSLPEFTRYEVAEVEFPSGAVLSFGEGVDSNLCLNCHQGRESTVSVDKATAGLDDDTVSDKLRFMNIHYFAAGATRFGTEARGAYEYEGETYSGLFAHVEPFSLCTQCHDTHGLELKFEACGTCHAGVEEPEDIRMSTEDFDGDGDTSEGIAGEIATLHEAVYAAMQEYATNVVGTGIVYDAHRYPYFFTDTNGNGVADPDEANYGNRYSTWTPRLLKAAYNYQYAAKDPGAFAHNAKYVIAVLYDSLADLGTKVTVDMTGMVRP